MYDYVRFPIDEIERDDWVHFFPNSNFHLDYKEFIDYS